MTRIFPVTGSSDATFPSNQQQPTHCNNPRMAQYSAAEPSTKSPEATLNGPNIANESLRVFAGELSSFNQNHNSQHTLKSSATSPVTKEGLNKLEFNQNEDEDRLSTVELFQGCIPLRLFLIVMVATLIVISCFFIWVSTFVVSKHAIESLANNVIGVNNQKILSYLDAMINPLGKMSKAMAADFNYGIANVENFRQYLFPKYYFLGATSCGYFFGYPSAKYTYSITGVGSKAYLVYSYQPPGFIGTIRDTVNNKTGAVIKVNSTIDYTPFFSAQQDYYNSTIDLSSKLGIEGVYGSPYKALNSSMAIYHSSVVYDPILFSSTGMKKAVGVTRINMSLGAIVSYLSKIVLIGRGYCLVSQTNGMMIGGSINTLAGDGETNLHLFNVTDRNVGPLMRALHAKYGFDSDNIPSLTHISFDDTSYIISHSKYTIDNLK